MTRDHRSAQHRHVGNPFHPSGKIANSGLPAGGSIARHVDHDSHRVRKLIHDWALSLPSPWPRGGKRVEGREGRCQASPVSELPTPTDSQDEELVRRINSRVGAGLRRVGRSATGTLGGAMFIELARWSARRHHQVPGTTGRSTPHRQRARRRANRWTAGSFAGIGSRHRW